MEKKEEAQGPKPKPRLKEQTHVKPHATRNATNAEPGTRCRGKKEMSVHLMSLQNPLHSPSFSASPLLIIFGQPPQCNTAKG